MGILIQLMLRAEDESTEWGAYWGVPYLAIFHRFLDFEILYRCLTFLGGKKHFLGPIGPLVVALSVCM